MITYWISLFFIGLVAIVATPISLLPDAVLPAAVNSGITGIAGFVGLVWHFFPSLLPRSFPPSLRSWWSKIGCWCIR